MALKKRFAALVSALAAVVAFTGCSEPESNSVPRPDIQPPEVLGGYVEYPEAPASKPVVDTSKTPSVGEYVSYGKYTVEETAEGIDVSWTDIGDWEYIYIPVENYTAEFGNFKITIETKGAERIAIQALYWEMYENGENPVTVFRGDLADGEQYLVAELGDYTRLDAEYQPITGTSLKDATILGFVVLIDSNPAQAAVSDKDGSAFFKTFEFLRDGDPGLDDKYVVPKINWSGSFGDAGYEVTVKDEGGIDVSYTEIPLYSRVYIPIVNFTADYAEFDITLSTTGVEAYSIGVMFSIEAHDNWQPYVELLKVNAAEDGLHTHTVNFDGTNPIDMNNGWNPVPGEYIKNYNVYQIVIWFDSLEQQSGSIYSGDATVEEVSFNRTATEGCTVGKAWSSSTPSITLGDDIIAGGSGTIEYSFYTGWYKLSMPVSSYEPKAKLTIKFLSEDPVDYFGIVVMSAGSEVTILSGWEKLTEFENQVDDSDSSAQGTIVSVSKEEASGIYTISFDFTNAKKSIVTGKAFWEQSITNIGFYLGDPNSPGEEWSGTRSIKFVSVEFSD